MAAVGPSVLTGPPTKGPSTGTSSCARARNCPHEVPRAQPGMTSLGSLPPSMKSPPPGAMGAALIDVLARTECPALTSRRARRSERSGAAQDPIVWREAVGSNVVDVDGNVYVDLTAGFGVAALGHRPPAVLEAIREQSGRLLHALGDVYPSDVKIELLEAVARFSGLSDARVILGSHGGDAIEAALKTAMLHTNKPGVLAFEGGYHGLSHGPLAICGYQPSFRAPFAAQLNPHVAFAPYPARHDDAAVAMARVRQTYGHARAEGLEIGAVVIEPMLGRGGVTEPPDGFLAELADFTREIGALLVIDEIFTGLHRTGPRLLSRELGVEADVLCLGKALGGGLPISACLAREEVMASWGAPGGEAIHTATFLGHPLACAASLATLDEMERLRLEPLVTRTGRVLCEALRALADRAPLVTAVRGRGLAVGVELTTGAHVLRVMRRLLERGYLVIPAAPDASVLQIAPPLVIEEELLLGFVAALEGALEDESRSA
jgi:4-aminobutyrate aminotransferase / (S)-3-amino-2-methylpropionate transaminase / 5-aminovalerate transaminase